MSGKTVLPFKYMGGKSRLASWIISHFPPHDVYVEPFGGAAHVLFRKPASILDVYNDINDEMVNLFTLLQDRKKTEKLLDLLSLTPHSRKLFYLIRDGKYAPPDCDITIQKAYKTLVVMKQGFSGDYMNRSASWSYDRKRGQTCKSFESLPAGINKILHRLRQVQIESLDFRDCIRKYDSPNTLFYCDPPYHGKEHYYPGSFNEQDHLDLAEILNKIKGRTCVSYYSFEKLKELYPQPKWKTTEKAARKFASLSEPRGHRSESTEILMMNY
jgi:DNA adenine methylase